MQEVQFPPIPKTEGVKYVETALEILHKVRSESGKEKAVRRWMRGQGYYDKGTYEKLFEFLDLKINDGNIQFGPFAIRMLQGGDLETRRELIFYRIAESNEILLKYVFEALQERLYSTNELYRMLTSYVYPGKEVDLPDFRSWLLWMEGAGRIRVLGIRWAPGVHFEECANYISSIDVDEILEEEAEDALAGEEGESGFVDPLQGGSPAAPAPVPEEAPEEDLNPGWDPPEDDFEVAEEEAAPEPNTAPVAQAPAAQGAPALAADPHQMAALLQALSAQKSTPELINARLLEPAPQLHALAAGVPLDRVKAALETEPGTSTAQWMRELEPPSETTANNVASLLEWWSGVEDRKIFRSDQFGIMPYGAGGWEPGSKARFLFRLACLGVCLFRGGDGGEASFAALDGSNFFLQLYDEPGSVERLMDELFEQGVGGRADLFQNLHLFLMLARSLRGAESWCEALQDLEAEDALAALWQRLAAYNLDLEVLWLARELSLFGLLRQDDLRTLRVVPTPELRRAAFHLGLIESSRATSLPALIAISRRLTPMMGHEMEAPLIAFWNAYGAHPPRRFWTR